MEGELDVKKWKVACIEILLKEIIDNGNNRADSVRLSTSPADHIAWHEVSLPGHNALFTASVIDRVTVRNLNCICRFVLFSQFTRFVSVRMCLLSGSSIKFPWTVADNIYDPWSPAFQCSDCLTRLSDFDLKLFTKIWILSTRIITFWSDHVWSISCKKLFTAIPIVQSVWNNQMKRRCFKRWALPSDTYPGRYNILTTLKINW